MISSKRVLEISSDSIRKEKQLGKPGSKTTLPKDRGRSILYFFVVCYGMINLPKEILHHILWYHTHSYHGLLSFRCINKSWKEASDSSPLWLICDLTFYCPKEYLLLRRRQFKIINDILIFIEWSAFIGSSVYKFYLFQPIVYTECIKVSCDNRMMLPLHQQKNTLHNEKLAKEVSRWFIPMMNGYYRWWYRCIYYRKMINYYYDYLEKHYLSIILPLLLILSCLCFAISIYFFNDLEVNIQEKWVMSESNEVGFYWIYCYCIVLLSLSMVKEAWKYLHRLEYQATLLPTNSSVVISEGLIDPTLPDLPDITPQPLPTLTPPHTPLTPTTISTTCFHNSLSVLYLSNREGYDEMMMGLFVSIFTGVLYIQYKIKNDLTNTSKHSHDHPFSEESESFDSMSSFPLLWSYSMVPFWVWGIISCIILWSRAKTLHLPPAVIAFSSVIGSIGCLCTIILLYLDRLLNEWWYQTSLTVIALFNTLLTILIIALLNYFLVLYHEIRYYPIVIDMKLVRRLGILVALILFLSLMVGSSSILIIEMRLGWKLFNQVSSLSWLLTYFFGFHGVIATKLLDEMLAHYWEI